LSSRQADIYRAALEARVRANVPIMAGDPQPVGFLVEIIIASVIGWLVQRCLSRIWPALDARRPGRIDLWRLNRAIRRGCDEAAGRPEAGGMSPEAIHALVADRVREAFLRTGRELPDADVVAFRAAIGP
jgi:hypothetical protein